MCVMRAAGPVRQRAYILSHPCWIVLRLESAVHAFLSLSVNCAVRVRVGGGRGGGEVQAIGGQTWSDIRGCQCEASQK